MGSKSQISLNFNDKVNLKDFFIQNYVCALTNRRYEIIKPDFCSDAWGHAPGVGLWGTGVPSGVQKQVARWATIAHLGACIMFGDTIIDDAKRQVTLNLEQ